MCSAPPQDPDNQTAGINQAKLDLMRERAAFWTDEERGYSHIHSTKPPTLGYNLNDSPTGLAAWIIEKYRS